MPCDVVGRVVRLAARRQPAGQAERVVRADDDLALRADRHQVEVRHQLARGRGHLGREARRDRAQRRAGRLDVEQPLAELADRQVRDRAVRLVVELVLDQAGELVLLVRHDRVLAQLARA